MEKKKFFDVFQTIKLNDELTAMFEYVDITKIATNVDHTKMRIYIESSRLIEKSAIFTVRDEIARNLANKLECASYMLYAPVVVEHEETKQMLMKERSIQASFELMERCNMAMIGVGELTEESTMCKRGHITKKDVRILRDAGFVGDIAMNPIREDGTWDNCPLTNRLLSASMECLKNIDNLILVGCGDIKVEAIQAALRTGCIDTLITDETTARDILEYIKNK